MQSDNLISSAYSQTLTAMHTAAPEWGKSGPRFLNRVLALIELTASQSAIDYGCGKGELARVLHGINPGLPIMLYDPGVPEFSLPPALPCDLVICTDVLEHVEVDRIDLVLAHIAGLANKAAYFVVHTGDCGHVLPDGRPAHILQRPQEWWEVHLNCAFPGFEISYNDTGLPCRFEAVALRKSFLARLRDKISLITAPKMLNVEEVCAAAEMPKPKRIGGIASGLGRIG